MATQLPPTSDSSERKYVCAWYSIPENRVRHNEKAKEWYHRNKDKVLDQRRQKHKCELCGGKYTSDHKQHHFRTMKHINAVNKAKNELDILQKLLEGRLPRGSA